MILTEDRLEPWDTGVGPWVNSDYEQGHIQSEMAHRQPAAWWWHDMETLSALLAICEGNPPIAGGFPSQRVSRNGSLATCHMMVTWHGNTFRITGHLWRESTDNWWFPSQRVSRNGSLATCLMMVSWHWNTFRIIGHLWRESTGNCNKGPVMWIFDNFFVVSTIMWCFWLFKSQQTCPQSVGICNIISCSISIKLYLFEISQNDIEIKLYLFEISQNEQWMNYNRVLIKFISLR